MGLLTEQQRIEAANKIADGMHMLEHSSDEEMYIVLRATESVLRRKYGHVLLANLIMGMAERIYHEIVVAKRSEEAILALLSDVNRTNAATQTNVERVCEMLDMTVLEDLADRSDDQYKPIYGIGARPELAAGLLGCHITPYFDSMLELEQFVTQHFANFEEMERANATWYVNEKGEDVQKPTA